MLIFGFGPGKAQDLGEVAPTTCPFCHNDVYLHHVRSKKSVRLYFVPVVPYGTDEFLLCPICTRGLQLSKEQVPAVGAMTSATAAHRAGQMADDAYLADVTRFWSDIGVAPGGTQVLQPAPPPPPASPTSPPTAPPAVEPRSSAGGSEGLGSSWLDQLTQLGHLHDEG
ncbi:MAG: hypothetical protein ACXWCM_12770, partial [Acidimicrobiales bacterium]